tara:strand:+ start:605 stop:1009 length:405 start_codon:yes stop_codon:yes gene_type:complete
MAEIFSNSNEFIEQLSQRIEIDKSNEILYMSLIIQSLNGCRLQKTDLSKDTLNIINELTSVISQFNCKLINEEDLFIKHHKKYILIVTKTSIKQTDKDSFYSIEKDKIKDLKENIPFFTLVLDKEVINFLELKE